MGSACIPWLCLLLLALPTPHAGVAVPRANLAGEADGSHKVKTIVTVYYCKDCGRERCKQANYADFDIIGQTENETFSNEKIQLVTNETHITMCFQQENMYYDGAYVIFWEKDGGLGDPCDILRSGDGTHSMTEEGKICCETQTDHANPHHVLKWYIRAADEKNTDAADGIIDYGVLGNHEHSVGENNQASLAATVVILAVCAGGAALLFVQYCRRWTQRHQGPMTVPQQIDPVNGETQLS